MIGQKSLSILRLFFLLIGVIGCARFPLKSIEKAMRPTQTLESLADDMAFQGLAFALDKNIQELKRRLVSEPEIRWGPRVVSTSRYIESLELLQTALKEDQKGARFLKVLNEEFEPFEVYGREQWGEVLVTSYFEPVLQGSRKKTAEFTQPLYATPADLVSIRLDEFLEGRNVDPEIRQSLVEQKSGRSVLRGRLVPVASAEELGVPEVVPYYDRQAIDYENRLSGQDLILAWVDPIDAFFLHIQGSGVVQFEDGGKLLLGYASQNGHKYTPIGKYLFDVIPKEKMSLQSIESHLRSLPNEEARDLLNKNESYVFFRKMRQAATGSFGVAVVPGRTIATDYRYFPKGALAYLEFEKPIFETKESVEPQAWQKSSRFVLDQDTGGAIRGGGRVDLFWGQGPEAKQAAGVMKSPGRLVYFVPKEMRYSRAP